MAKRFYWFYWFIENARKTEIKSKYFLSSDFKLQQQQTLGKKSESFSRVSCIHATFAVYFLVGVAMFALEL